jgi:hypothetical protein
MRVSSQNIDLKLLILSLKASDKDLGLNSKLRYSILTGNAEGYFTVDTSTGQLSTTKTLDYEKDKMFTLLVQVHDLDGNSSYGQSFHDNAVVYVSVQVILLERQFFSMSRICDEKCSKPKIFLAYISKLLCFSFIL